jgi:hypothetical protein
VIHICDVAAMFGVTRQTISKWVTEGKLRRLYPGWIAIEEVVALFALEPVITGPLMPVHVRPKMRRKRYHPAGYVHPKRRKGFDIEDTEEL